MAGVKTIIYGLTFGGVAWFIYDAITKSPTVDTVDNQAGGVVAGAVDSFLNIGYQVGLGSSMNNISLKGLYVIKQNEGFKPYVYKDGAGFKTIGYGHKLTMLESFTTIDEATASKLLAADVTTAENAVNSLVKVPLNQNQFDALCSFVFNVGAGAFSRSTMLKMINAGNYAGAAGQFGSWCKITVSGVKVTSGGLLTRRQREADLFQA